MKHVIPINYCARKQGNKVKDMTWTLTIGMSFNATDNRRVYKPRHPNMPHSHPERSSAMLLPKAGIVFLVFFLGISWVPGSSADGGIFSLDSNLIKSNHQSTSSTQKIESTIHPSSTSCNIDTTRYRMSGEGDQLRVVDIFDRQVYLPSRDDCSTHFKFTITTTTTESQNGKIKKKEIQVTTIHCNVPWGVTVELVDGSEDVRIMDPFYPGMIIPPRNCRWYRGSPNVFRRPSQ